MMFAPLTDLSPSDSTLLSISGQLISQLPGIAFVKTNTSVYVESNEYSAYLYGFKKPDQLAGLNDYELKSSVIESADDFRNEDQKVFHSGSPYTSIHINNYIHGKRHIFLTHKIPIKNPQGTVIGLNCIAHEIAHPLIEAAIINLFYANKYYQNKSNLNFNIQVDEHHVFPTLNPTESELLYFINIGLTQQNTGLITKLSSKCIEEHLNSIQYKLNCSSHSELLDLCQANNYHAIIPKSILDKIMTRSISSFEPSSALTHLLTFNHHLITPEQHSFKDKATGKILNLTAQQQQCLYYLLQGKCAKEIAREMNLSYRTIEHYSSAIRKKNGYTSMKKLLANVIFS